MLDSRNFIVRTLLADGVITEADHRRATDHATSTGMDLIEAFTTLSIVTSRKLAIAQAKICECPFVDLSHYEIDFGNTRLLPRATAERAGAFPIFVINGVATVAMLDPLNLQGIDQVRQALRCDVDPVQADAEQLRALIVRAYSLAQSDADPEEAAAEQSLTTGDEPIVAAVNQILSGAADAGASDIHINPDEQTLHLRYRVDGVLAPQQGPPRSTHDAMVQRLKVMAKLDMTQTRKPQDGKFRFKHKGEAVDVRLSLLPTIHGENVVMRLLRSAARLGPLTSLGMPEEMTAWFEELINKPHGVILVTGPTGSGKTTTLYTALNALNAPDVNIMTIEDPVEIRLPLIRQVQVNTEIGLTFSSALRSILRQDPDVVLVGEVRDDDTARIAVQAAMTGHLVLSTLHTNDAVGSIDRLKNMGVPGYAIASGLLAVIAQRLVRRVCPHCAIPETNWGLLTKIPTHERSGAFVTPRGCYKCGVVGYKGRTPIFEMLRMTPRIQPLIEVNGASHKILEAARADGYRTLFENGVRVAAQGITTLDEVVPFSHDLAEDDLELATARKEAA